MEKLANIFMIKLQKIILILIVSISFLSCEKKLSNYGKQEKVLLDVFAEIVDSTYIDRRIYCSFPEQGKPIYDKKGKWIGLDSTGQHKRDLEYEIKREKIKNDKTKLVIAIDKKQQRNRKEDYLMFIKHFKNIKIGNNEYDANETHEINLSKFPKSNKFEFKYLDEFPNEYKIWEKEYPFEFGSIILFSKTRFDSTNNFGFLTVFVGCGERCGVGYIIFIKKVNEKWKVDKIKQTSIS